MSFDVKLPCALYIAAVKDAWMGSLIDVERFRIEYNHRESELLAIGQKYGFNNDYNHISMLTGQNAADDYFPYMLNWLKQFK